ncbi:hypothetical protein A1O7_09376 [Cladophialophora yegresii CBS 114405]|uniref:Uncharacterized protein n=1 Tax=Cladophialophora yegresii CBS 114405 TaxID=1182544 RepID=W9W651_9EURO|nr:uncharacterized protein A1O7_09376 [Cladophialophora yegresii CBS 114405]EXJ54039.1 hypothetical protein A1O7_09376 [Cladophialophora yegresii CBS 114405]
MADGVFLWAALVAGDLKIAADQGDSEEDLESRLEECPAEMNDLFTFLLEKQDTFYAKHPKPYLALIYASTKAGQEVSSLDLLLASSGHEQLKEYFASGLNDSRLAALDSSASNLEANIVARCANLVEYDRQHLLDYTHPKFPAGRPYKSLNIARLTVFRFIHRIAQDFLVESRKGAALLRACGIFDQDALKLLMLSSAIISAVHVPDPIAQRPLRYAGCIQRDLWTPDETDIVDSIFAKAQAQNPWSPPWELAKAEHTRNSTASDAQFSLLCCPQISTQENVAHYYADVYCLSAYFESKLLPPASNVSNGLGGFCLIRWTLKHGNGMDDLIRMLKEHVSWTQSLTLCYKLRHVPETVHSPPVSVPLWQHMYIAAARSYLVTAPATRPSSLRSSLGHIPLSDRGSPYVECILVISLQHIYMCPTTSETMVSIEKILSSTDLFKVRVDVCESTGVGTISLDFRQYSPGGVTQFFEIDPIVNHALQKLFHTMAMQEACTCCGEFLVPILNQHLDRLAAAEIAQILHGSPLFGLWSEGLPLRNMIFPEGEFRLVSEVYIMAWEEQVKSRTHPDRIKNNEEPDRGGEADPLLSEVAKALESLRRTDEQWWEQERLSYCERLTDDESSSIQEDGGREETKKTPDSTRRGSRLEGISILLFSFESKYNSQI